MKKLIRSNIEQIVKIIDVEENFNLKENELLVEVLSVGLCRTDLLVAKGEIAKNKEEVVLGHEFCARVIRDGSNLVEEGTLVGFNPLYNGEFMGLDFDGALAEKIVIPRENTVIVSKESKLTSKEIAYLEPVAASAAPLKVLKSPSRVLLIGNNRISSLTEIILKSYGHEVVVVNENNLSAIENNSFEYIIETVLNDEVVQNISRILVEGGTWILKSRKKTNTNFISTDFISKEIRIRAVNYYDFEKTMTWLDENAEKVGFLLGKEYHFFDWNDAFEDAMSNERHKIFIKINK
jgi:threonine dehydrogenase-like Zn-dependent dehydrogenase